MGELPAAAQSRIRAGEDVLALPLDNDREAVVATLSGGTEVVQLGPFPDYVLYAIEDSIGGWIRLTAAKLETAGDREACLRELQPRFEFPVILAPKAELPAATRSRVEAGQDVVFYSPGHDRWFAATPLSRDNRVVRFGPFPSFERIEQKAATTTLTLVLLPVALAIALLLRPVARQLRQVEGAAKAIAAGDLSARVNERRIGSARPLAQAFNNMAVRTETLVRSQRELLQAVSHELRTPLSRMRFAVDLLESASDDDTRRQRLHSLDAAIDDLEALVSELLAYVRLETAGVPVQREQFSLRDTLEFLLPKLVPLHPALQFAIEMPADQDDVFLFADRTGFQRAIGNLLNNAAQFAQRHVAIRAESTAECVTVDVDDDGVGIPVADRERVFDPFVRLDNGQTGPGAGLGLAIVKRTVLQHGGSAEVLTSPLGGCRVRTRWPHAGPCSELA